MAKESVNGSDPAKSADSTPYERFESLTREILSVPKTEIDKRRAKASKRTRRASRTRS